MSEAGRAASAHSAPSWSSSVARERSMMAVGLRGQALLCILGAVACIVMLYVAGIPYAIYQIQYGYLGSGPGETASLVNSLLYGTVATAIPGTALTFRNRQTRLGL